MTHEGNNNGGGEFDGTHTLTEADLVAIRKTIFATAPIAFMDTQEIVLENGKLKAEVGRLRGWLSLLTDKLREDFQIRKEDRTIVPR